jgi:hypothetical protein
MVGELASDQPEEPVTEWLAGLEPVLGPAVPPVSAAQAGVTS